MAPSVSKMTNVSAAKKITKKYKNKRSSGRSSRALGRLLSALTLGSDARPAQQEPTLPMVAEPQQVQAAQLQHEPSPAPLLLGSICESTLSPSPPHEEEIGTAAQVFNSNNDVVIIYDRYLDGARPTIPIELRRYDEEGDDIIWIYQKPEKIRLAEEFEKVKLEKIPRRAGDQ